jgi:serine/threonine protein kinase
MIYKTISHYKIIKKLGEGGMGVVYKAQDTKLDRDVALKFLSIHLTANENEKRRFLQEAKAAAALNHLNICTIYEVDEFDGQSFIAMELVEGQNLKEKIKAGPAEVKEAIDIAVQIAEGLRKAHEKGIIHRDIKSANIMVNNESQVKIMDFGLAKLAGQAGLTKTRSAAGTVAYMSPEQIQGQEVDPRSDIWSYGVVLYEMLTGQLPFKGDYESAIMYSILNEQQKSLDHFRPDILINIEQIINKSLKKNKEYRYQSFLEILKDLRKPADFESKNGKQEKSIIVLPFDDMSPNKDNEYFSDGLTEEIIADLSHIQHLIVISRTSAMRLKGTDKDIKTIGRELNVKYVLEGSVRKAGNNLRITAQLIDAKNDSHLWAEKYNGTLDDVFDIQEKVSRSIVDTLKIKLTQKENEWIANRPIDNIQAYECYIKARQDIWTWTEEGLERALSYLQSGLNIVGENILLYFGIGYVYWTYVIVGFKPKEECLSEAENYANKILKIKPESPHGHLLLGITRARQGNYKKGAIHLKKHFL